MKAFLKHMARCTARVLAAPAVLLYRLQSALVGPESAFPGWSQFFSLLPGQWGIYLRHAFYSGVLRRCGADAWIGFGVLFSHPGVSIGRTAYVGPGCSIGHVEIGDDVLIASHVSIMNGCRQHEISRLDIPVREQPGTCEPISIGADTWIGERAVVAASVGKHCVIGAGSVVLSSIPDYAVAVGSPARVIRDRRDMVAVPETRVKDNRNAALC